MYSLYAKIFESGSAASALEFNATRREIDWQNFVAGVDSCAPLAKTANTFDCLREANTSDIFIGLNQSIAKAPEEFGFNPTTDGPGGVFPDVPSVLINKGQFAPLPFIAGTNLDEGSYTVNKKCSIFYKFPLCFQELDLLPASS